MIKEPTEETIEQAVAIIKSGGLVAFPTDTVYCLGADPYNEKAIARIFKAKQRPGNMALPVIVADMKQMAAIGKLSPLALHMAKEFFPVGFTLVVPRLSSLPDFITAGKETVAVRIQDHPVATAIARKLGTGIAGTSANVHGNKSPVTGIEVEQQLDGEVDLIIDGSCQGGIESTIVDVTGDKPVILRQGAVTAERVEQAWQKFLRSKKGI